MFHNSCALNSPRFQRSHGVRASTPTPTTLTQVSAHAKGYNIWASFARFGHPLARLSARPTTFVSHLDHCHNPSAAAPPMENGHDIVRASSIDSARTGAGKAAIYERFMANATHRGGPAATTPPSSGGVSTERGAVGIDRQAQSGEEERWRRGWTNYTESGEDQL